MVAHLLTIRSVNHFLLIVPLVFALWFIWYELSRRKLNGVRPALMRVLLVEIIEKAYLVIAAYLVARGVFSGSLVAALILLAIVNQYLTGFMWYYLVRKLGQDGKTNRQSDQQSERHRSAG